MTFPRSALGFALRPDLCDAAPSTARTAARSPAALGFALALLAFTCAAQAQQVYRVVGPDGKVTYSDRAPATAPEAAARVPGTGPRDAAASAPALPAELRQVAQRFPVTLYTGPNCGPCGDARNLLVGRGVPFTERTVATNEDIEAFQKLNSASSLPFATVGAQQLVGFASGEWTQYLDAAGYPQQSKLPSGYRAAAATPLAPPKPAVAPVAQPDAASRTAAETILRPVPVPARPAGPSPSNPAGIRF